MKRCASVTFAGVLADGERDDVSRSLASSGTLVTSWTAVAGRSYAALERVAGSAIPDWPAAVERFDEPGLVVLRISPRDEACVADVARALGGAGRPRGIVATERRAGAIVVAFAPETTSLGFVVALVDAVLEVSPGRTIEALLPLDDTTLAAYAGALLGEPRLGVRSVLETHLEPVLARVRA